MENKFKEIRKKVLKLTLKDIAEELGTSATCIKTIEDNSFADTKNYRFRYVEFLLRKGLTLNQIFGYDEIETKNT